MSLRKAVTQELAKPSLARDGRDDQKDAMALKLADLARMGVVLSRDEEWDALRTLELPARVKRLLAKS